MQPKVPCEDCLCISICYAEYKKMEVNFVVFLLKRCELIKEYLYYPAQTYPSDIYAFFRELKQKRSE